MLRVIPCGRTFFGAAAEVLDGLLDVDLAGVLCCGRCLSSGLVVGGALEDDDVVVLGAPSGERGACWRRAFSRSRSLLESRSAAVTRSTLLR